MKLNNYNYITRSTGKNIERNWWLVKSNNAKGTSGYITLRNLYLPKYFVGKRVRLKLEVVEE